MSPSSTRVADGDLDLPHGARDVGLDLRHVAPYSCSQHDIDTPVDSRAPIAYTAVDWETAPATGTMDIAVRRDLSSRGARRTGEGSGGRDSWTTPPAATGPLRSRA